MFLVSGAAGNVGGEVVRALADAGQQVRALVRSDGPPTFPQGVQVAAGDLNRPDSLASALAGVDGMFLLSGYADMPGLLSTIRDAGVERVVLLSGTSAASGNMTNAISRYMILSEAAVHHSQVHWTVLRSYGFMSNALQWAEQIRVGDVVRAPFANVPVAVIDPYDIAAVACSALSEGGHESRTHVLSGPEASLPAERVGVLATVLGRDLRFEAQPDAEARTDMSAAMPPEYVDAFFDFYVNGSLDESELQPTVEEITGRRPHGFEQWADAHADAFR